MRDRAALWLAIGLAPWLWVAYALLYHFVLPRMLGFDFDEVMMVCMGFAGVAYVIVDLKRERRLDQFAVAICEDIATLKAVLGEGNPHPLNERVAALEVRVPDDIEARLCGLENDEDLHALERRLAAVEVTLSQYELGERVSVLEARADHKPITQTRGKGGKFASPQAMQDEIDALRAELVAARKGGA